MVDYGQPWSFRALWTMKWPSFDHGHGTTDWPWSIYRIWLSLTIIWPWLLTMVDHGHDNRSILQTWSTMVRPWSIDGHFMVDHGQWPWSTMVWPWSCCKGYFLRNPSQDWQWFVDDFTMIFSSDWLNRLSGQTGRCTCHQSNQETL